MVDERAFSGLVWSGAWSASIRARRGCAARRARACRRCRRDASRRSPRRGAARLRRRGPRPRRARIRQRSRVRPRRPWRARPLPALTTFNTWFVHGIGVDERTSGTRYRAGRGRRHRAAAARRRLVSARGSASMLRLSATASARGRWMRDRFPSGLACAHRLRARAWAQVRLVGRARARLARHGRAARAWPRSCFSPRRTATISPGRRTTRRATRKCAWPIRAARAWVLDRLTQLDRRGPARTT